MLRIEPEKKVDPTDLTVTENVLAINRVTKVVKGGRRLRFSALVVVGDSDGHVGAALGKADEVPEAIRKAVAAAKKSLLSVPRQGTTLPQQIEAKFGAARILLKPALPGTGVIAGTTVRAVLQSAGITDAITKSLGSSNPINLVRATLIALSHLKNPAEELARRKGKPQGKVKSE